MYGVTMWWWRTSSQGYSNFYLHDWAEASHTENCEVCALENTAAYIVPSSAVLLPDETWYRVLPLPAHWARAGTAGQGGAELE